MHESWISKWKDINLGQKQLDPWSMDYPFVNLVYGPLHGPSPRTTPVAHS